MLASSIDPPDKPTVLSFPNPVLFAVRSVILPCASSIDPSDKPKELSS